MPHVDPNLLIFGVVTLIALVLWRGWQAGSSGPDIDRAMTDGLFAMQQSNWVEAEVRLESALSALERQTRPDIAKTMSCMLNLAQCYERLGKHKEAASVVPRVLAGWERQISTPGSSMVDIDFAATHSELGRGTGDVAEFYIKKVIPIRERTLPRAHPDTVNSYKIAARLLRKLGRSQEAEQYEARSRSR